MAGSVRNMSTAWAIGIVGLLLIPGGAGISLGAAFAHSPPSGTAPARAAPYGHAHPDGTTIHDLVVTTTTFGGATNAPLTFTASLAGIAGLAGPVNWTWGDSNHSTSTGPQIPYGYGQPGIYQVEAQYTDPTSGTVHDNLAKLLAVPVWATHAGDSVGTRPQITGWVVANGTASSGATALVAPGGSVTVAAELSQAIPAPSLTGTGASFTIAPAVSGDTTWSAQTLDPSGVSQVTASFSGATPPGLYPLTFLYTATVDADNLATTVNGTFEFTVVVGSGLGGGVVPYAHSTDPTSLTAYQVAFAPTSLDPTIDYDSNGAQLFRNVYQTLIIPNGSATGGDPNSFLPSISTCVPGSAACTSLYGSSLVSGYNYTFVIGNSSQFYDPTTVANWPVFPSDVEFTVARAMGLSNLPCFGCTPGWMLDQALLPGGNGAWDSGFHNVYNNTPSTVAAAMTINGTDCPSAATLRAHGCVTFHVDGGATSWPFFEQLLANPLGASIVPCGWFSAPSQSAGIPYWSAGNITGAGDQPCPAWGAGMGTTPGSVPATGWDLWEFDTAFSSGGVVYSTAAGSGPYELSQYSNFTGYTLSTNPYYSSNPECTTSGCNPAAGTYIPTVVVNFESTTAPGMSAIAAGAADWADADTNDSGALAADAAQGLATTVLLPQLEYWSNQFDFDYNLTLAQQVTGTLPTAPANLLTDPELRQFLSAAFPYATTQSQAFTLNGTQYAFPFGGGVIPLSDGGSAPSNVSWPFGDPVSNPTVVGSDGWWWAQTQAEGLAGGNCTALMPCDFPVGYLGPNPLVGAADAAWAAEVSSISGGAIVPQIVDLNVSVFAEVLYGGPGNNPMAVTTTAWLNDYPDPTDAINALYTPTSIYGTAAAYPTVLQSFNASSCSTSPSYWADPARASVPADCQGAAYNASLDLLAQAATTPVGAGRNALFAEAEQIERHLALDSAVDQRNAVAAVAPWIDPTSVPANAWLDSDGVAWYLLAERTGPAVPLGVRGPVAAPAILRSGQSLNLSAAAVGGVGGYSYGWSGLPAGCPLSTQSSWQCVPSAAGPFTITVTVHDGAGHVASASVSVLISGIAIASFSATPSSIVLGATTTVTTVLAVASGTVTYSYTGLPKGCASSNVSSFTCQPSVGGLFDLVVNVLAPNGSRGSASTSLTVTTSGPKILGFAAAPSALDVGGATTLTLDLTNATAPVTVVYAGVPGCNATLSATATGANWTAPMACTPTTTAAFTVYGNVTAANGRVNGTTSLTVNALPAVVSLVGPTAIDLGQHLTLTATASGGTTPFAWSYTGLPAGCTSANSPTLTCTPTGVGASTITVHLADTDSERASATASLTVNAALQIVNFVSVPDTVPVGGSTNLTVRVGGGTAPFSYAFTGLPSSCPTASTGVLRCIPTTAGTYTIAVGVRDATGATVNGTALLNVTASGGGSSPPATLGGLPLNEALGLIAVLVIIAIAAALVWRMRGPKRPAAEPPEAAPAPSEPDQAPAP
ncbi:MAG: hypothetical protein L3K17_00215 [Thermoplasmata archaeon]|nr:hypothetical protein [Thermoplasmata archaeon]